MKVCKESSLLDEKHVRTSDIDIIFSRSLAMVNLMKPYRPRGQILRKCNRCTTFTECIVCGRRGCCTTCRACKICKLSTGCTRGDSEFTTTRAFYLQFLHGLLLVAERRQTPFAQVVAMVVNGSSPLPSQCPLTCCGRAKYPHGLGHSKGEDDLPWRSRRDNEA